MPSASKTIRTAATAASSEGAWVCSSRYRSRWFFSTNARQTSWTVESGFFVSGSVAVRRAVIQRTAAVYGDGGKSV